MASAFNFGILAAMNQGLRKGRIVAGLGLFTLVLSVSFVAPAADSLDWRKDKDSVDADISSWSLLKTLEQISEATGWQVYVEPGTQRKVSTKFKDRPRDRALDLLLGNLGRVLLPGTNGGPPRFLVFRNTQKDATRLIRGKRKAIPNELIVRMKKGKNVDDLAKEIGAKVLGKSEAMNAGRLQFKDEAAADKAREALLDNEDVTGVDQNFAVTTQPTLEGMGTGSAGSLNLRPLKDGDPLVVALIDTAVQWQGNEYDSFLLPALSVTGEVNTPTDKPTHGTSMFEVILKGIDAFTPDGSTTPIKIRPVNVFGPNGESTSFEVAEGILLALNSEPRPSFVNLSLGSYGHSSFVSDVIQQGTDAGVGFAAAAGNTPTAEPMYPAADPNVIGVTAGPAQYTLAPWANSSPSNDALAPATWKIPFNGKTWIIEGTSPAAAGLTGGVMALMASGQTRAQAVAAMLNTFALFPPPGPTPSR